MTSLNIPFLSATRIVQQLFYLINPIIKNLPGFICAVEDAVGMGDRAALSPITSTHWLGKNPTYTPGGTTDIIQLV